MVQIGLARLDNDPVKVHVCTLTALYLNVSVSCSYVNKELVNSLQTILIGQYELKVQCFQNNVLFIIVVSFQTRAHHMMQTNVLNGNSIFGIIEYD